MNIWGRRMSDAQKQQIARLERELKEALIELEEYKSICNNLNVGILKIQLRAHKDLIDSSDYDEIMKRIKLFGYKTPPES